MTCMGVITLRLADSPTIGTGSPPGGYNYKFIANQDKKFKFSQIQTSENGHKCHGNHSAFCYVWRFLKQ